VISFLHQKPYDYGMGHMEFWKTAAAALSRNYVPKKVTSLGSTGIE
jgi:hypothetical protein